MQSEIESLDFLTRWIKLTIIDLTFQISFSPSTELENEIMHYNAVEWFATSRYFGSIEENFASCIFLTIYSRSNTISQFIWFINWKTTISNSIHEGYVKNKGSFPPPYSDFDRWNSVLSKKWK